MSCDKYLELLSARLDGALTADEELEEHLAVCPECRAAGAQLAALQGVFDGLEDVPAPEGFAEGVMDRIRAAEAEKKVVPLFKRPQFKALAGLAACLALVAGLYGAAQNQKLDMRSFNRDAVFEADAVSEIGDIEAPEATSFCLGGEQEDHAYDVFSMQKAAEGDRAVGTAAEDVEPDFADSIERFSDSAVLILERMPEGAEDLIPPETVVSYHVATGEEGYSWMTDGGPETLDRIERLAKEQEITAERSSAPAAEALYDLVILNPNA